MNLERASPNRLAEAKNHLNQAYSCYEETEKLNQALLECDAAIEIAPNLVDAHNLRGLILEELGRKTEALEAYKQAIHLNPDFSDAKNNLTKLKDELALLPRWLRNSISGMLIFLAVTYSLELYVSSRNDFSTLDRLLGVALLTLYTPGIIVQLFLGNTGLEPEVFNWTIHSISSLTFAGIGGTITLRRKKGWLLFITILLLLYLLSYGFWWFFSIFADMNIG